MRDAQDPNNTLVIAQSSPISPSSEVVEQPGYSEEYLFWLNVALKLDKMTGGTLRVNARGILS